MWLTLMVLKIKYSSFLKISVDTNDKKLWFLTCSWPVQVLVCKLMLNSVRKQAKALTLNEYQLSPSEFMKLWNLHNLVFSACLCSVCDEFKHQWISWTSIRFTSTKMKSETWRGSTDNSAHQLAEIKCLYAAHDLHSDPSPRCFARSGSQFPPLFWLWPLIYFPPGCTVHTYWSHSVLI